MSKHDAAAAAAGYLFQPEKASLRLAKAPKDASIGVETGDDVVEVVEGNVMSTSEIPEV